MTTESVKSPSGWNWLSLESSEVNVSTYIGLLLALSHGWWLFFMVNRTLSTSLHAKWKKIKKMTWSKQINWKLRIIFQNFKKVQKYLYRFWEKDMSHLVLVRFYWLFFLPYDLLINCAFLESNKHWKERVQISRLYQAHTLLFEPDKLMW